MRFVCTNLECLDRKGLPVIAFRRQGLLFVRELGTQGSDTDNRDRMDDCVESWTYDTTKSFVENLKSSNPNVRWAVHYSFVEGKDVLLLTSFCEGQLRIVTDGSHHPEWNLATAALCAVAQDDTCLTTVLQAPGRDDDLQSHRAELSGHFAAVTILEQLKMWASREGRDLTKAGAIVACDNKESLRVYNQDYFFDPTQADFDLLQSIQARIRELKVVVRGEWVKGHQDARMAFESLDCWGKMNVKCDNLAKAYLTKIVTHFPRPSGCRAQTQRSDWPLLRLVERTVDGRPPHRSERH